MALRKERFRGEINVRPSAFDKMLAEVVMMDEERGVERTQQEAEAASPKTARRHMGDDGDGKRSKAMDKDHSHGQYKNGRNGAGDGESERVESREDADAKRGDSGRALRRARSMPATRRSRNSSKSPNSDGEDHADEDSDESDSDSEAAVKHVVLDEFAAPAIRAGVTSASEYRVGINAQKMFLTRAPKNGAQAIRCYVERDRHGLNRLHPVFRLFLEDGKQFLLCAQRRAGSKTANYLLTMERNPTDRRSALIVGKLRGNWSGSEYFIFDDGLSHSKTAIDSNVRSILGVIEFAYDEMGPGKLNVRIPTVQEGGAGSKWKDPDLERGGPQARKVLNDHIRSNSLFLRNKRPQFDAKSGGHVLDFQGRVTMASIKNFQIQCDDLGDSTILQFGRVSCQPPGPRTQCSCHKNLFIMDVKYPLSPLQAFAVCLSTLDSKVADLKLYDNVARLVKKKGA